MTDHRFTNISGEEQRVLMQVRHTGLVAFHPCRDGIIARLVHAGLVEAEQVDAETALLRPTAQGRDLISQLSKDEQPRH